MKQRRKSILSFGKIRSAVTLRLREQSDRQDLDLSMKQQVSFKQEETDMMK